MGISDFFSNMFGKKDEPDYDPLNVKITDLKKGFIFEYDMKTWEVKEEYEYDWGNNNFTREFKIDCGDDHAYLHIEEDDDLILTLMRKVKIRSIDEDLPEEIINNQTPPKKLFYQGKIYFRENENPGYFKDVSNPSEEGWAEFISWDYFDETGQKVINVEQWGEREFEASIGTIVKEFEISNILPVK